MSYCNKHCRLDIATVDEYIEHAIKALSFEGSRDELDKTLEKYVPRIYTHVKNARAELSIIKSMMNEKRERSIEKREKNIIEEMINKLEKQILIAPYDKKPTIKIEIMKLKKKLKESE